MGSGTLNACPLETQIRRIWAASAPLAERFDGSLRPLPGASSAALGAGRWERLQAVLAACGPGAVDDFAAQFGRAPAELPGLLGLVEPADPELLPSWAPILAELLEPLPVCDCAPSLGLEGRPFPEFFGPLQQKAEELLRARLGAGLSWLPATALAGLSRALRARWETDFGVAVFTCFDIERSVSVTTKRTGAEPGSVYAEFVAQLAVGGLGTVADRFPVAARLLAQQTELWLDTIEELILHFAEDLPELQRADLLAHPELKALEWPLSDFHDGGRAVARLDFVGGETLFYKPADRSLDLAFDQFFRSGLVRGKAGPGPALRGLTRHDHSWIEGLPASLPQTPREATEVARDLGRLGVVATLLGTTDLHPGNLIAGAGWVRVCDAETVVHPEGAAFPWSAPFLDPKFADLDNPFRSFLCSFQVEGRPEVRLHSCLGNWTTEPAKVRSLRWQQVGTDEMALEREFGVWPNAFAPVFAALQEQLGSRWAGALVAGAAETQRHLSDRPFATRHAFERLAWLPRRVIRRNTVTYAWMQAEARWPALLNDGFERSLFLERIGELSGDRQPLQSFERDALEQGDIPRLGVTGCTPADTERLANPARPIFSRPTCSAAGRALRRELARAEGVTLRADG